MPTTRLAAILFTDIVGYTAMMQTDQERAMTAVKQYETALRSLITQHKGELLQTYGDGSLSVFDSASAAVRCAKELQEQIRDQVPLRIGIHLGEITIDGEHIFGDGVNIASRIESMGVAGAVLVSSNIRQQVKNKPEFEMESLGKFSFKNVSEPMTVYALANEGFAVPKRKEVQGKLKLRKGKAFPKTWAIGLAILILCLLGFVIFQQAGTKASNPEPKLANSIAVMPFKDMSSNKDQEYFGDGIAEEILNTLAQLKEIKVAGRTSSFSFKGKEATIAEIGAALNVTHILEGSVRKDGEKIRITAQLINVKDGFHLWSQKYDKDFRDIFDIQDEVAKSIGKVLFKKLGPEQISKVRSDHPNSEAYEYFLKGKHLHENKVFIIYNPIEEFKLSESFFLKAIELDSTYAMAHAGLSLLYDTYTYTYKPIGSEEKRKWEKLRDREADIAYRLDPDNYYANEAKGWMYFANSNFQAAFTYFLKSYQVNPASSDGLAGLGFIYTKQGLLNDALAFYDKALEIDPLRQITYRYKALSLFCNGKTAEAIQTLESNFELNPDDLLSLAYSGLYYALLHKNQEAIDVFTQVQQLDSSYYENSKWIKKAFFIVKGDLENAEKVRPDYEETPFAAPVHAYLSKDQIEFEKQSILYLRNCMEGKDNDLSGIYLFMLRNSMWDSLREKPWFQEMLQSEKEKYEQLLSEYPRANEVL